MDTIEGGPDDCVTIPHSDPPHGAQLAGGPNTVDPMEVEAPELSWATPIMAAGRPKAAAAFFSCCFCTRQSPLVWGLTAFGCRMQGADW